MTLAPPDLQLSLMEVAPGWHITKNAQARNAYGTVAQHLVCTALHLTPIRINGNYSVCFDAIGEDATYYEIKSVKSKGGKMMIYDWRMQKEASVDAEVVYAILLHNVKRSDGRNLVAEFIHGGLELLVMPAKTVHEVAKEQTLNVIKHDPGARRNGYNREGYKDGYRNVPIGELKRFCQKQHVVEANYAGHEFSVVVASGPF